VCCWSGEIQTTPADFVARFWNTSSEYGLVQGVVLKNGHLENLKEYERIT